MRKVLALAVALGLLLVLAVAAELTFGTWFSKDPLDRLGLSRNAKFAVEAGPLYAGGTAFIYGRDRWGFRGDVPDPARISILTVGGSTTSQPYLPDDKTWQAAMERQLRAEGREVTVGNAGLDGASTQGHLRAMTDWFPHVPGLKPRFVLFYVGVHDVEPGGAWAGLKQLGGVQWIRQHSGLARLWHEFAGGAARKVRLGHQPMDYAKAEWTDKPLQPDWKPDKAALAAYVDRLKKLAELTHAMGAVPILVTQPRGDYRATGGKVLGVVEGGGLNGLDHYKRLAAYNQATRALCDDQGLLCLDAARELAFEPGDFYDYLHNSPQGAEKLGHWLAAKLAGLV